ncbi:MAG: hypothetical protein C0423_05855 [Methylibium sp.]|nr:hypothetical protein [Methylibium sp.]
MATESSARDKAWAIFDRIVADAAPDGVHSNPWSMGPKAELLFNPDYGTLKRLLGVPLYLKADSRTGVPALALDVWISYELRRAGFEPDAIWPRPSHPRILPAPIANLLKALPSKEENQLRSRLTRSSAVAGVTSSSASILGKNYVKQVDVIMTDWATGPELLISTKRMDSSYGKNAANRVEESYGDAKNLRLRHPLAALGFVFGLRSDVLQKEPDTAEWLIDLLGKLGREDDAYHATCLVLMEYSDRVATNGSDEERASAEPVPEPGPEVEVATELPVNFDVNRALKALPVVEILEDKVPEELAPGRFLSAMVARVLGATPVNMHKEARRRRGARPL